MKTHVFDDVTVNMLMDPTDEQAAKILNRLQTLKGGKDWEMWKGKIEDMPGYANGRALLNYLSMIPSR